ncbi:MAG: sigma-70 family RNA polymerase sigma factor [Bacteroidota bacterium]
MKQEFIHIVSAHQNIIHKVVRVYRDTSEDREDLFQEIVYQLWKSYPAYEGRAKITTWMYQIALNTAIAKYRKKRINTHSAESLEVAVEKPSKHPERERLYRAIGTLNEADKAVITLYLDDYRYEEIADMLGITSSHVGVKLHRIKEKLIHLLNPRTYDT